MSNKLFNILRTSGWLVPALAVFYGVIATECNLPGAEAAEKIALGWLALVNTIVEKLRYDFNRQEDKQ